MASYNLGGIRIEVVNHFRVDGANFPTPNADLIAEGFEIDLFDNRGNPLNIIHGKNRLTEYWVGRKVQPVYDDDGNVIGTKRGADFRSRFWPEVKRRISKYRVADALGVDVSAVDEDTLRGHGRYLGNLPDPEDLRGRGIDNAVEHLTGRAPQNVGRIPRGTVVNIDATFDSSASTTSSPTTAATLTLGYILNVERRVQIQFPTSSISATSVDDSDLQFNVTFINGVDAGDQFQINDYGTSDPETDSASTRFNNSDNGNGTYATATGLNTTGSKTFDLGATADSEIFTRISSPGWFTVGLDPTTGVTANERVDLQAIENTGTDPPTLTLDYTATSDEQVSVEGSQPESTGEIAKKYLIALAGALAPIGALSATLSSISLAGTLASTGALTGVHKVTLAGELGSSGALTKKYLIDLSGELNQDGLLSADQDAVINILLTGDLGFSGELALLTVDLMEGDDVRATRTFTPPAVATDFEFELTTDEKNAITDWGNLSYRFTTATANVRVTQANLTAPFGIPAFTLAGVLPEPEGSLSVKYKIALAGDVSADGTATQKYLIALAGSLPASTGALTILNLSANSAGELSFSGTLHWLAHINLSGSQPASMGSLTFAGNFALTLAGNLSFAGSLSVLYLIALEGVLAFEGDLDSETFYRTYGRLPLYENPEGRFLRANEGVLLDAGDGRLRRGREPVLLESSEGRLRR